MLCIESKIFKECFLLYCCMRVVLSFSVIVQRSIRRFFCFFGGDYLHSLKQSKQYKRHVLTKPNTQNKRAWKTGPNNTKKPQGQSNLNPGNITTLYTFIGRVILFPFITILTKARPPKIREIRHSSTTHKILFCPILQYVALFHIQNKN